MDTITKSVENTAVSAKTDAPLILHIEDQAKTAQSPAPNAANEKDNRAADSAKEVSAGTIPALVLDHGQAHAAASAQSSTKPSAAHHWYDGTLAVVEDIGIGAYKEVTQHPLRVVESFAIGATTAAIASVVAAPVAIAATVAGLGYGAYQIYKHAPDWVHSAEELQHPEEHSQAELARANQTWQNFGGGATDLAAGIAGGIAYRAASTAISQALEDGADAHPVKTAAATSATNNDGGASSQAGTTGTPGDGGASGQAGGAATPTDGGASGHGAVVTGHEGSVAHHALATGQVSDSPTADGSAATATETLGPTADGGASESTTLVAGEKAAVAPVEATPLVDLSNPAGNTDEAALRTAFRQAITTAQGDNTPLTIKVDTTVPLTDAAGNPIKLTQADVLYQELQAANPENHYIFSKPDLQPGDAGYSEFPAPQVVQDALHISTKENAITLAQDTEIPAGAGVPEGTTLPAGTKFAVGTTYDGTTLKSALPDGKVWAVKPDGSYVMVTDAGQSTSIPAEAISVDPKQFGQLVNAKTPDGFDNHIIIRTDAKAVAPDGQPLLDAYPSGGASFEAAYKEGTQPGLYAPKPKLADHFKLPQNMTVEANTNWGASTASGAKNDYFMKSGFADAQEATAKNYSGPTLDQQSAAELLRIRTALGLAQK